MILVDEKSKKSLVESLTKLQSFGQSPRNRKACDDARSAIGEIGFVSGQLLGNDQREDTAMAGRLTELDGYAEALYGAPADKNAKQNFTLTLGDIEYRIKRLFNITVEKS